MATGPVLPPQVTPRPGFPRPLPARGDHQPVVSASLLALQHRLRAAAAPLGLTVAMLDQAAARSTEQRQVVSATAELLELALAGAIRLGGLDRLWLLLTCVQGQFPLPEQVVRLRRDLELDDGLAASRYLLSTARIPVGDFPALPARIVTDQTIIDIGNTAGSDLNTGIQRVVREVLRRWIPGLPVLPVAWTRYQSCTRTLTAAELQRTTQWGVPVDPSADDTAALTSDSAQLVIPWRTTYLIPELPLEPDRLLRLTALARYSGSRIVVIGYDLIPITNVAAVGPGLASLFAHYLALVKHSAKVIAISDTAADEFRGLAQAFSAQGQPLAEIVTCVLPTATPPTGGLADDERHLLASPDPMVLCVGSIEARKNHLGLLHAAELLWREGLAFRLLLIGKVSPHSADVVLRVEELRAAGRDVELRSGVSDTALGVAYRTAHLSVFVSTHEGYGLPVAESIASGTPVVTTHFGSTAEAALGGGAILVDPHDDDAIAGAIRLLLTDDAAHGALVAACRNRAPRTWDDYAAELWAQVQDRPEAAR